MSAEIEQRLVGAMFHAESNMQSNAFALAQDAALDPDAFTEIKYRQAWSLMLKLASQKRSTSLDAFFTYAIAGKVLGRADMVWLEEAATAGMFVSRTDFSELAATLRNANHAKRLATAFREAVTKLEAPKADVSAVLEELDVVQHAARQELEHDVSRADMDLAQIADQWQQVEEGVVETDLITTGFAELDALIGGYVPNLNVVIGAPSEGKSAFIGTSIERILDSGLEVGLCGLEDGTLWYSRRNLALRMKMNSRDIGRKKRTTDEHIAFDEATEHLAPRLHKLQTFARAGVPIGKLLQVMGKMKANGARIIFIDHGGEIDHSSDKADEHRLRVALSIQRLRTWAFNEATPVVLVMHTRRKNDNDTEPRPPRPDEVRDTAEIERSARVMIGVWQVPEEEEHLRLSVAKATDGARNKTIRVKKAAQGVMLDPEDVEPIDLFVEKMNKAKAKKAEREAERNEAKLKLQAEREERTTKKKQGSML